MHLIASKYPKSGYKKLVKSVDILLLSRSLTHESDIFCKEHVKVFPVRIGKKSSNSLSLHWLHCSFRVWLHWLQCSLRLHWFQCSLGLHWLQCFLLHWSQCSFRLHWLQCSFRGPVESSWMEKARLASVAALPPLPKHSLCFLCLKPTVGRCFVPNI